MLRDYQQRSVDELYQWFAENKTGNPCLVLPTGSGKSHIVAALCKNALQSWPDTRVLMLTHQAELIEQNAEKMHQHWPNAPLGVYSASLGSRDIGEPITFAGIGSVRTRAQQIGHIDLILVDECHRINNSQSGSYRKLIGELTEINPRLRVVGLSATPYRLGQGCVTDGEDALFHDLIEPVTISHLINMGYLSKLKSKATETHYDISGVKKRGGEYIEKQLQEAVGDELTNRQAVSEILARAGDRKSWIIFCTGVGHSEQVAEYLRDEGVTAECVSGSTSKSERERILREFKSGKIKAVTNCNVLTTGFDHTGIDLIAMMRPTLSPGLYVQIVGRGMRVHPGKEDCLVLDFAENISRHGPIINVKKPSAQAKGGGEAPVKECPMCAELVHASAPECPECGHVFEKKEKRFKLASDDIMGEDSSKEMIVTDWKWSKHVGRTSKQEMLKVVYYGALSDPSVSEYVCLWHDGYAGRKAAETMAEIVSQSRKPGEELSLTSESGADAVSEALNRALEKPSSISYTMEGRYHRVTKREWEKIENE